MKAIPVIALLALTAAVGAAADATPPEQLVLTDLTFESGHGRARDQIQIRSERGRSTVWISRSRLSDDAAGIAPGEADGPVRFSISAEAGRTDCSGTRTNGVARGTCRFASAPAFEGGLQQRGVALERRRDLLTLTLVDARLALVEDFSRDGFMVRESGDLIAASALGMTGAWSHELKGAGLTAADFNDLIAARALNVDGAFLRAMAGAGYANLSAHQAVAMKAVGVTPEYAAAMNRAALAEHAIDEAGKLQ